MSNHNIATSIILAGGKSSRLGTNKALEMVGDRRLIQRVIERLMPISCQIIVAGSTWQTGFPSTLDVEYQSDLHPGQGPLGGIYTGLLVSKSLYNVVVACDMPFLNIELFRYMLKLCPGSDAVIPVTDKIQPLHGIYAKSCLDNVRTCVENNWLQVIPFLDAIAVRYVTREECQQFDTQLLSFFNINSPADLARANMLVTEEDVAEP